MGHNLCRVYLEERITRDGCFSDSLESDAQDLRFLIGMGPKEAENIEHEVKESTYKKMLREEVTSGRLDAAASKAELLGELVEKVKWDGEQALALHESIYRQKLSSFLEKTRISDDDDAELVRLQKLLCVPNEVRNTIHKELCGDIFSKTVSNALAAGVDRFSFDDRQEIRKAMEDVKLSREAAKEIVDDVARKYLLKFISTSRSQKDRISSAKELKKMVFFSNLVLAPIVDDLKTEEERKAEAEKAAQQKEIEELMAKAREEAAKKEEAEKEGEVAEDETEKEKPKGFFEQQAAEQKKEQQSKEKEESKEDELSTPKSLEKAETAAASRAKGEVVGDGTVMKSQKDITLANDLALQDRLDVYKNYLLYCMTGDVIQGPMGVQMVTERDESEFARLSQLGDVLGLTQIDVAQVHQGLAEQAYKGQVEQYMGDGLLTPEKAKALEDMREKMGLNKEAADKIVKGIQNQKLVSSMQAAKAQGSLTLDRILELKEAGVDPTSLVTPDMLRQMYRQEVSSKMSDGSGSFDSEKLLVQLPKDLGIEEDKAKKIAADLVSEKKRTTLVQAVSFLRQKNTKETFANLNNLLSCALASPDSGVEQWNEKEEIADLFTLYCAKESDGTKRDGLRNVLGLTDEEASSLQAIADSGEYKIGPESEEENALF